MSKKSKSKKVKTGIKPTNITVVEPTPNITVNNNSNLGTALIIIFVACPALFFMFLMALGG